MTGFPQGTPADLLALPVKSMPAAPERRGMRASVSGEPKTIEDDDGVSWAFWRDRAGQWFRFQMEG